MGMLDTDDPDEQRPHPFRIAVLVFLALFVAFSIIFLQPPPEKRLTPRSEHNLGHDF